MQPDRPSSRSLTGMILMIVGLTLYAFAAAAIGDLMVTWPLFVQMLFYLIAGLAWIWPAKKLLEWMGRNR